MPSVDTVFRWFSAHPEFCEQYARAIASRADTLVEESLEIADDGRNDWMERNDPNNPGYLANGEHIQRSKLRVDTRRWFASKLAPKKYGDRLQLAGDPDAPLVNINLSALAPEQLDVLRSMLAALVQPQVAAIDVTPSAPETAPESE